jgi:hypothetical protein
MARDPNKQQAAPEPPMTAEPFTPPANWHGREAPHGTYSGKGSISPPVASPTGQAEGEARRTPTPGPMGIAKPGSTAMLGR